MDLGFLFDREQYSDGRPVVLVLEMLEFHWSLNLVGFNRKMGVIVGSKGLLFDSGNIWKGDFFFLKPTHSQVTLF